MGRSSVSEEARERAHLLIRLAAISLGGTLVLLGGVGATSIAAVVLALYLAAAVSARYIASLRRLPLIGIAVDLAATTGLVLALPLDLGPWILYAFAIGGAALQSGPIGAVTATAVAVVGFDGVLLVRGTQARATDLWPVQALIAIGLVTAEIVWALRRQDVEAIWSRIHGRALSGLTRQREPDELLRTLVPEIARLRDVRGAWVWRLSADQRLRTVVTAGAAPPEEVVVSAEIVRALGSPMPLERILPQLSGLAIPISSDPPLTIGVALEPSTAEDRATTAGAIHDLVGDASSLLAAAYERVRADEEWSALETSVAAIEAIDAERTQPGVLAATVLEAERLIEGRVAIVRPTESSVLVGDLPGGAVAELARDRRLPAIVKADAAPVAAQTLGPDAAVALVTISEGRVLAAIAPEDVLTQRLGNLERIAQAARERLGILAERDALQAAASALGRDVESLGGALRAKEDALATAVHELRNPLTAVHGYATLMSRNLQAVQGQLAQLERLMADLLSAERRTGDDLAVDAVAETKDAIARARVRGATIDAELPPHAIRLAIGQARFAQVLDNLIANAMKYSPAGAPILVALSVEDGHGKVRVTDQGTGIAPNDLARIFDRFYRVSRASDGIAGQGLGLSICKEIVTAHGGHIWAESEGAGRGSTFVFTLPLVVGAPV